MNDDGSGPRPGAPANAVVVLLDSLNRHMIGAYGGTEFDTPIEAGGENYHTDFDAWDYTRGHEGDPWKTALDPSWLGTPALPAQPALRPHPYETNRTWFLSETDFPGPRTMQAAADWLEVQAPQGRSEHHLAALRRRRDRIRSDRRAR